MTIALKDVLKTDLTNDDAWERNPKLWIEVIRPKVINKPLPQVPDEDIIIETELLGHKDKVKITGIWFSNTLVNGNPDMRHDAGDAMWSDADSNSAAIQGPFASVKQFGLISDIAPRAGANSIGLRYTSSEAGISAMPVNIDITRRIQPLVEYRWANGWETQTAEPLAYRDGSNDDRLDNDEINTANTLGAVFSFDSPQMPQQFNPMLASVLEYVWSFNAKEFVRVSFGNKPRPTGNTLSLPPQGSRASDFAKFHSIATVVPDLTRPGMPQNGVPTFFIKRHGLGPGGAESASNEIAPGFMRLVSRKTGLDLTKDE